MHQLVLIHSDPKLVDLHVKGLSRYFRVDSAYDGLSGLRLIREKNPNLVISDYDLPRLSGSGLVRFVRSHPKLHRIPYIILSSGSPLPESLDLGVTEWLTPKIASDELIKKCLNHLKVKTYV